MYRKSLLATLDHSARMWHHWRNETRKLRRWLKHGELNLQVTATPKEHPLMEGILQCAVLEGATELAFLPRRMTGLSAVDQHPDFWLPSRGQSFDEGLKAMRRPSDGQEFEQHAGILDTASADHFLKHCDFQRIDEYIKVADETRLRNGYGIDFFPEYMEVMRASLRQPCRLKIIAPAEAPLNRRFCTVQETKHACGVDLRFGELGIAIHYE